MWRGAGLGCRHPILLGGGHSFHFASCGLYSHLHAPVHVLAVVRALVALRTGPRLSPALCRVDRGVRFISLLPSRSSSFIIFFLDLPARFCVAQYSQDGLEYQSERAYVEDEIGINHGSEGSR